MNNQINKYIIKAKDNDVSITNTAIKLVDDERNVMNKTTIRQRAQLDKVFSTATSQRKIASHMTASTYNSKANLPYPRTSNSTKPQC